MKSGKAGEGRGRTVMKGLMNGGTVSIIIRTALTGLYRSPVARCSILATAVRLALLHAVIVPILAPLILLIVVIF